MSPCCKNSNNACFNISVLGKVLTLTGMFLMVFFHNTVVSNSANTINSDIVGFSSIGLILKIH